MRHNRARRIQRLEEVRQQRTDPIGHVPTWAFFATERFQAAANYDNAPAAEVLERVEAVDRAIEIFDAYRAEHNLDTIGIAALIQLYGRPGHVPAPNVTPGVDSVTQSVVEAAWHAEKAQRGEDYAWRNLRNWERVKHHVAPHLQMEQTT